MYLTVAAVTVYNVLTLGYCQGQLLSQATLTRNTPTLRVLVCVCSDAVSVTADRWKDMFAKCREETQNINNETTAEETTTSTQTPTTTGPVFMGCFEDDGDRVLPREHIDNDTAMTIDMCRIHCTQKGYSFFGLEDGQQCFCGNVIKSGYLKVSDNQCDRTCTGDPTKTCGGSWRIAIYQVV